VLTGLQPTVLVSELGETVDARTATRQLANHLNHHAQQKEPTMSATRITRRSHACQALRARKAVAAAVGLTAMSAIVLTGGLAALPVAVGAVGIMI
jgi:hypothetical protein